MLPFGGGGNLGAIVAQLAGGTAGDKPENWTEERLDLEIQSELERLNLARWTARTAGFGSTFAFRKFLIGGLK